MKYIDVLAILDNTANDSPNEFPTILYLLSSEYQKKLAEELLIQENNTEKDNSQALDSDLFGYKSIVGSS